MSSLGPAFALTVSPVQIELVAVAPPYRSDSGVALLVKADVAIDAKTDLATLCIEVRQGTGAAAYLAAHTAAKPVASNDPEGTIA
ncbi:MAG: hypothetical protein JHC85_15575, partial [Chthoniobacterales bacterium]|nr:hypothetical protein [Chthoniobacterales bacterium]